MIHLLNDTPGKYRWVGRWKIGGTVSTIPGAFAKSTRLLTEHTSHAIRVHLCGKIMIGLHRFRSDIGCWKEVNGGSKTERYPRVSSEITDNKTGKTTYILRQNLLNCTIYKIETSRKFGLCEIRSCDCALS